MSKRRTKTDLCTQCGKNKTLQRKTGTYYSWCTACIYKRNKEEVAIRLALIRELKGNVCFDCNGEFPSVVIELDHPEGVEKLCNPTALRYKNKKIIRREIAKCEPVCANCHRIRTFARRGLL